MKISPEIAKGAGLNQRQSRLLTELAKGPLSREQVDDVTGASNGPEVVGQLRRKGWEITCERVPHIDRDGVKGVHGVYSFPETSRDRLADLQREQGGGR